MLSHFGARHFRASHFGVHDLAATAPARFGFGAPCGVRVASDHGLRDVIPDVARVESTEMVRLHATTKVRPKRVETARSTPAKGARANRPSGKRTTWH